MTDRDLNDGHKSSGGARDENETHRGWKSKWVESKSPSADVPSDVRYDEPRLNPPEPDDVPDGGGVETP